MQSERVRKVSSLQPKLDRSTQTEFATSAKPSLAWQWMKERGMIYMSVGAIEPLIEVTRYPIPVVSCYTKAGVSSCINLNLIGLNATPFFHSESQHCWYRDDARHWASSIRTYIAACGVL